MSSDGVPELEVATGVQLAPVDVRQLSGMRIKAFSLQALETLTIAQFGEEVVTSWRKAMPYDFAGVTATSWVPVEFRYHLVELLVRRFFEREDRRAWEVGSQVAQREISGFFRFVMRFTAPSLVLGMSSRFWRSYYDRSEFVVVESGAGFVHAEVRDWPLTNAVVGYELAGALREWLLASNAPGLQLTRIAWLKPGVLRLEARW